MPDRSGVPNCGMASARWRSASWGTPRSTVSPVCTSRAICSVNIVLLSFSFSLSFAPFSSPDDEFGAIHISLVPFLGLDTNELVVLSCGPICSLFRPKIGDREVSIENEWCVKGRSSYSLQGCPTQV